MRGSILYRHNSNWQSQTQTQQTFPLAGRKPRSENNVNDAQILEHTKLHRSRFDLQEGLRLSAPSPTAMPSPALKDRDGYRIEAVWNLTPPSRPGEASSEYATRGFGHKGYTASTVGKEDAATSPSKMQSGEVHDLLDSHLDLEGMATPTQESLFPATT